MNGYLINDTQPEIRFIAYCVEIYKHNKHLTGSQVSKIFAKHKIWKYLYECYGALHTTGPQYTIQDIDEIIQSQSS